MLLKGLKFRESVWAIYDFADTIFSMNIISLYFPLLIVSDLGAPEIYVGIANSISQIAVVFLAPLFGTISDRTGRRMGFFWIFVLGVIIGTTIIGFYGYQKLLWIIIIAFIFANVCYQLSLTFYNSLLPRAANKERWGIVSGIGTAFGYIGSIVGMALIMPFNTGKLFGLNTPIPAGGREATFFPTAILFFLFALPTLIYFSKDEKRTRYPADKTTKTPLKKIWETLKDTNKYPGIRRFLLSRFLFHEAVETTIIFMAVFAEKAMGFNDSAKILFFVICTTFAVIGSFIWGKITDIIGPHKSLIIDLVGWIIALSTLSLFPTTTVFWGCGVLIGIMLGGVWTIGRPYLLKLTPIDSVGRFFGLYSLTGKAAATVGPLIWGATTLILANSHGKIRFQVAIGIMSLLVIIGLVILIPNSKVMQNQEQKTVTSFKEFDS